MIIHLETFIGASPKIVFDLSLNIDLHKISTAHTGEEAIAGKTSGKIGLNETVTWRARHLFKWRTMTSKIIELEPYTYFTDKMVTGDFKSFVHHHYFEPYNGGTLMKDVVVFESPYGLAGRLVDMIFMKLYLQKLLGERNRIIREYAITGDWKKLAG